jgi:hypothetical protein
VEKSSFRNLLSFSNVYWSGLDEDIVSTVEISYSTIKRLHLDDYYNSSDILLKFVKCCRDIEELSFRSPGVTLSRSDIIAIASLPRLNKMRIDCWITRDAIAALSRCRGLQHLALPVGPVELNSILPSIGRNLVSLEYDTWSPCLDTVNEIIEYCPNVRMLDLHLLALKEEEMKAAAVGDLLKRGLKMLTKLKVNRDYIRLGTDWALYYR